MKLEYTEGCICDSISVDGIESIDMDINDFKKVVTLLLIRENDLSVLQTTFMECMQSQGEFMRSGPCGCCGDFITTYTLEI